MLKSGYNNPELEAKRQQALAYLRSQGPGYVLDEPVLRKPPKTPRQDFFTDLRG